MIDVYQMYTTFQLVVFNLKNEIDQFQMKMINQT